MNESFKAKRWLIFIGAVYALLAAVCGVNNLHLLNSDAVAYLRVAEYWAEGEAGLRISGYWSPMISWLIAGLTRMGLEPIVGARIVMGVSGLVFWLGSLRLFRALELKPFAMIPALGIVAAAGAVWSAEHITPDLLMAGILLFGLAELLSHSWPRDRRTAFVAGILFGAAYLAKAVALPFSLMVSTLTAFAWMPAKGLRRRDCLRGLGWTWLGLILVSSPWILTLSLTYQKPTIGTSGPIAHAIVGPSDRDRYHPFARHLHSPEPGRISAWEDPSRMDYRYWSPFENSDYFKHQLNLIRTNAITALRLLGSLDAFFLSIAGLAACLWIRRPLIDRWMEQCWRWIALPVVCLIGIYLPVYIGPMDLRYFYPLLPLLLAGLLSGVANAADVFFQSARSIRNLVIGFVLLSFLLTWLPRLSLALSGIPDPASLAAHDLAFRMREAGLRGSIAGSGLLQGGRTGLYLAYLIDSPWLGDQSEPDPAAFVNSGAAYILARRGSPLSRALENHGGTVNQDSRLFAPDETPDAYPLVLFGNAREE